MFFALFHTILVGNTPILVLNFIIPVLNTCICVTSPQCVPSLRLITQLALGVEIPWSPILDSTYTKEKKFNSIDENKLSKLSKRLDMCLLQNNKIL